MSCNSSQPTRFATTLLFLSMYDEGVHGSVCSCFKVTAVIFLKYVVYFQRASTCAVCLHAYISLCSLCVCVCFGVYQDSGLKTTSILFSQRPLKLPPLHQVSVWLPGNQGSSVLERRCLFPTNDPPERREDGRRWG